jgi:hypothetical protein
MRVPTDGVPAAPDTEQEEDAMSRRGDRRPAVAAPLLTPRRLLGWVAAAGALLALGALAPLTAVRVRAAAPPATPTRWDTFARPPG